MTAQAIALILVSALLHAGWNLIGKRTAQTVRFYAFAMGFGMLIFSPLLVRAWDDVIDMPAAFWLLLILSGLCQTLYMTGLSYAYRAGDLSLVYPLARAIPVLLVPMLVLLIYGQSALDLQDVVGMLLIILGSLALPLNHWRNFQFRNYCTPAIGWVLMAASATAGYSLVDSMAIGMMTESGIDAFSAGSSFVVLQAAATLLWMLPFVRLVMKESLRKIPDIGMTALAGSFIIGTYLLILISMSMVNEVSYVVALRQISIPLGVAIGVIWLREPVSTPRLQGLLLMLTGLVMVSL
ncbi:EamA family transporter [Marinobacterium sp. YM272]|uniref:EamA family transporter n=1 Tax=Marinobacterium sp. YM272 TaxID=3421654 RepID=UPI003D7F84A5